VRTATGVWLVTRTLPTPDAETLKLPSDRQIASSDVGKNESGK
jgi:hypothetical protein